jgi:hypothetical protein
MTKIKNKRHHFNDLYLQEWQIKMELINARIIPISGGQHNPEYPLLFFWAQLCFNPKMLPAGFSSVKYLGKIFLYFLTYHQFYYKILLLFH